MKSNLIFKPFVTRIIVTLISLYMIVSGFYWIYDDILIIRFGNLEQYMQYFMNAFPGVFTSERSFIIFSMTDCLLAIETFITGIILLLFNNTQKHAKGVFVCGIIHLSVTVIYTAVMLLGYSALSSSALYAFEYIYPAIIIACAFL